MQPADTVQANLQKTEIMYTEIWDLALLGLPENEYRDIKTANMHTKSANTVPEGVVSMSWDKGYPTDGPFHGVWVPMKMWHTPYIAATRPFEKNSV